LPSPDLSEIERSGRLRHLVSQMYFAQQYEWHAVLSFHGAVLLEIERGLLKWGDSFFHLESRTLYGHPKTNKPSMSGEASTVVLYCRDFQRQPCSFTQAHYGYLRGERKWLRQICADCWVKARKHGCVENEEPKTKTEDRIPCGLKRRPTGLKRRPTSLKRRPTGLKRRPTGLKRRPTCLKRRPTCLKRRPTGLKRRPTVNR